MQKDQKIHNHIFPDIDKYKRLSEQYKSIVISIEIPNFNSDGVLLLSHLNSDQKSPGFIFQRISSGEKHPTKTMIGIEIEKIITINNANPMTKLRKILMDQRNNIYCEETIDHIGAFGYVSYECFKYFEKTPNFKADPLGCPESLFLVPKTIATIHHDQNTLTLSTIVSSSQEIDSYEKGKNKLEDLAKNIYSFNFNLNKINAEIDRFLNTKSLPIVEKKDYLKNISNIKNQIIEGELIQCVLTQRFQKSIEIENANLIYHLSKNYPSEYLYQLVCPDFSITGSSPEMFLSVKGNIATIRPVAGTIGNNPNIDSSELEIKLKSSIKDKAEHIMLVDLARNDLGKVSKKGTVKVKSLMETQIYNNVIHLVSEVTGIITNDKDSLDAFSSTFPIGTLVGAPKIRASELINDLEPEGRGPYCGAIGWFSKNGNIDTSTIIRTIIKKDGKVSFNGGGGIVFDSIPEVEYQETLDKMRAFI